MDNLFGKLKKNMLVFIKMIKKMDLVFIIYLIINFLLDFEKKGNRMEQVNFVI